MAAPLDSRIRQLGILAVLVLLTETGPLEVSLVYPAAESLTQSFGSAGADAVTGTVSLTAVVCIPLLGRIADVAGKKRVLLCSGALFAVGSLLCAVAASLPLLLLGRILQGAVGGALAVAYAIVRDVFPRHQVPVALGVVSSGVGISGLAAPFLGGALVDRYGYPGVFWFLFLLSVLVLPLAAAILPDDRRPNNATATGSRRLDVPGALLLGLAAAALVSGISAGVRSGWSSPGFLAALPSAALLAIGFWRRERSRPDPAIDLGLLTAPAVRDTLLPAVLTTACSTTVAYLVPQLLQTPRHAGLGYAFGLTALAAAGWTFTLGLGSLAGGPIGGYLARRSGPRSTALTAQALVATGALGFAALPGQRGAILLISLVFGLGTGLTYVAFANLITEAVPDERAATGTALLAVANQLGAATGASVLASVRTLYPVSPTGTLFAGSGYRLAFICAAAAALLALLATWRMRHGRAPATGGAATRRIDPSTAGSSDRGSSTKEMI
ncbi:MFS family permease [Streptomyces sp. SAI-135]|uniref:MFS transporter n=1 Tax=unclassified Streptomyces TaxID=2593676 RepID=UPI0024766699|nr:MULTISPECIES: MFS transporter [unclassified Streptomyces]MDH6523071.1 MFS family permease [Streptomyces sp. SAI-090]MDH6554683.1 MFS family permease [Streptomyces sp. SAI-041]MDH6573954.1 MFS family permease [Streptomyces sp. SAI-117]MDH6581309.1 MFS family permease [Streptomyces sp. SAI-133]MDH6613316.1 MFS family permease [Streptomyces sp. SAI-135]